jgi:hypothetical protein
MWRFRARKAEDGFAVWDSHLSGWRSVQGLTEAEAWQQASDLDVLYDATGQRNSRDVRLVEEPVPVDVASWRPAGVLDVWVREGGQWWGRVRDDTGRIHWHSASDLRPAKPARPSPVDPVDLGDRAVPATSPTSRKVDPAQPPDPR